MGDTQLAQLLTETDGAQSVPIRNGSSPVKEWPGSGDNDNAR